MSTSTFRQLALALALGLPSLAQPVLAQPPTMPPPMAQDRGFDVEARLAELRQRLSLDDRQTERVRVILQEAHARMQALRASSEGPGDERVRLERRQILWDVEDRIWALLSCPQKDAFRLYVRERAAARMDAMGHRRGHGMHGRGFPHGRGR